MITLWYFIQNKFGWETFDRKREWSLVGTVVLVFVNDWMLDSLIYFHFILVVYTLYSVAIWKAVPSGALRRPGSKADQWL